MERNRSLPQKLHLIGCALSKMRKSKAKQHGSYIRHAMFSETYFVSGNTRCTITAGIDEEYDLDGCIASQHPAPIIWQRLQPQFAPPNRERHGLGRGWQHRSTVEVISGPCETSGSGENQEPFCVGYRIWVLHVSPTGLPDGPLKYAI